jgi:hypothetical protein
MKPSKQKERLKQDVGKGIREDWADTGHMILTPGDRNVLSHHSIFHRIRVVSHRFVSHENPLRRNRSMNVWTLCESLDIRGGQMAHAIKISKVPGFQFQSISSTSVTSILPIEKAQATKSERGKLK